MKIKKTVLISLLLFVYLLFVPLYFINYAKKFDLSDFRRLINEILNEKPNLQIKTLNNDYQNKLLMKKLDSFDKQLKEVINNNNILLKKLEEKEDKSLIVLNSKSINSVRSDEFDEEELADIKKNLKLYDLKKESQNEFDCVKSANVYVQTTICIHDLKKDIYISHSIKTYGGWELHLVRIFMNALSSNKDFQVLDFGAQLGQFSLFAAKLGRKVVAVEPFYHNYIRIHKSAQLESTVDNIILVTNGLSDRRGDLRKLQVNNENNGGQAINESLVLDSLSDEEINADKYILRTIEIDDLLTVIPEDFKEVIMKIDIEGYEIRAFKKASKLFSKLKINAVFIEWMGKNDPSRFKDYEIEEFLEFIFSRGYVCRHPSGLNELDRKNWKIWPDDVIFTLKEFKI